MSQLEDIRLSLDEIGEALKRLGSNTPSESQSLQAFKSKVSAIFPQIEIYSPEDLFGDGNDDEENIVPLWWDDLDEPYELEKYHWLTKIQKTDVLTPERTIEIMTSIEAGVLAEAVLSGKMKSNLVETYDPEKLSKVVELGVKGFDEMVTRNLKLVLHLARKYRNRASLEDAFSFGVFGLMQAIKKFDWRLGHQFSTYASWWLRQSMAREIADTNTTIDIPLHAVERVNAYRRELREYFEKEFTKGGDVVVLDKDRQVKRVLPGVTPPKFDPKIDTTLSFALEASAPAFEFWDVFHESRWLLANYETPDNAVADFEYSGIAKDLATRLTNFVLSERELEVLLHRHGVMNGEPKTLEEIGALLGVTRERVRQIEKKSISKLNVFLMGVNIFNYWEKIENASEMYRVKIDNDVSLKLPTIRRDECGKESGYRKHRAFYEEPCQACKRAHRKQNRSTESQEKKQKVPSGGSKRNPEILHEKNKERSLRASTNQVVQVQWALEVLKSRDLSKQVLRTAEIRLNHPDSSLSELAKLLGENVTKDMVAGNLRRLIRLAVVESGQNPPEVN